MLLAAHKVVIVWIFASLSAPSLVALYSLANDGELPFGPSRVSSLQGSAQVTLLILSSNSV